MGRDILRDVFNPYDSSPLPKDRALVLCRTPFQAVMLRQVLRHEGIERYDLVYLTQDNAEEDAHYFKELSARADRAQYLVLEKQTFDILNHAKAYWRVKNEIKQSTYTKVLLSSIDHLAFRKLTVRNKAAQIISFDDGLGHIVKNSHYLTDKNRAKSLAYALAFGAPARRTFLERITRHYSAHRGFENIMPPNIIHYIDLFESSGVRQTSASPVKFFIGQPFEEYRDAQFVSRLAKYIEEINCDYYVKHPRESAPLINNIPLLPKEGRIAEEAILKMSGEDRPVIVGGFSSVLINISPTSADKIMILSRDAEQAAYYAELGKKAGCEIIYI